MIAARERLDEAVAVADAGTFAGACKIPHVSTSHASKVIVRLEARLFNRTTRRIELTDAGRAFVEQSRRIIQERDKLLLMVNCESRSQTQLAGAMTHGSQIIDNMAAGGAYSAAAIYDLAGIVPSQSVMLAMIGIFLTIAAVFGFAATLIWLTPRPK